MGERKRRALEFPARSLWLCGYSGMDGPSPSDEGYGVGSPVDPEVVLGYVGSWDAVVYFHGLEFPVGELPIPRVPLRLYFKDGTLAEVDGDARWVGDLVLRLKPWEGRSVEEMAEVLLEVFQEWVAGSPR